MILSGLRDPDRLANRLVALRAGWPGWGGVEHMTEASGSGGGFTYVTSHHITLRWGKG